MDSFETRIEAKCIAKPDNGKCRHNGMDFADDKCRAVYEANIGKIIADINGTVNDLFNDPMCCGYGEDDYPRRDKVTGEWYIGDVHGYYDEIDGLITFLVLACCVCKGEDGLEDYYGLNHFFDLEDGELVCVRFDPRAI